MSKIKPAPNLEYLWFGRLEIHVNSIRYVRELAMGAKISVRAVGWEEYRRRDLDSLVGTGLAEVSSNGDFEGYGKNEVLTYTASQRLKDEAEHVANSRVTFQCLALQRGVNIGPAAIRAKRRKRPLSRLDTRSYPAIRDLHVELVKLGENHTENLIEEEGDEYQFSAPELTVWYVREFCSMNHLM